MTISVLNSASAISSVFYPSAGNFSVNITGLSPDVITLERQLTSSGAFAPLSGTTPGIPLAFVSDGSFDLTENRSGTGYRARLTSSSSAAQVTVEFEQ